MITSHGTCKENLSNNQWGLKLVIISFFLVMLMFHLGDTEEKLDASHS